jgi:uncharacterized phage protein (TIGR02220 family)
MESRSRIIRPSFFINEDLGDLEPLTRLLFAGLWTIADREGRLKDRPKRIKALILPYDEADPDEMLKDLQNRGFIIRYIVDRRCYIQIINWSKHQKVHYLEKASEIPPYSPSTQGQDEVDLNSDQTQDELKSNSKSIQVEDGAPSIEVIEVIEERGIEKEEREIIPYLDIINYLNKKTGKNFRAGIEKTERLIKARWNQSFRLEDFKRVIDNRVGKWATDEKMKEFLRPETLFGIKFEGYLNDNGSKPHVELKATPKEEIDGLYE